MYGAKRFSGQMWTFRRGIHRRNSYYDALGITPKATQADIKSAFYKLSMQYHPDKSTGCNEKFREISSAYEVLGNLKLRKMYDKGFLPVGASQNTYQDIKEDREEQPQSPRDSQREWVDFQEELARRQEARRKAASGKTDAYNFDEWNRRHYSDTFNRSRARGVFHDRMPFDDWTEYRFKSRYPPPKQQNDILAERFLLLILTFIMFSIMLNTNNYDRPIKPGGAPPR